MLTMIGSLMIAACAAFAARDPLDLLTLVSVGDLDRDGSEDVLVLAQRFMDDVGNGRAVVHSGKDLSVLIDLPEIASRGNISVCAIPDVDKDDVRDLAVASTNGVTLYSGRTGKLIRTVPSISPNAKTGEAPASVACLEGSAASMLFVSWYTASCGSVGPAEDAGCIVRYSLASLDRVGCTDGCCKREELGSTIFCMGGSARAVWTVSRDSRRDRLNCFDDQLRLRFQHVERYPNRHFGERLNDAGDWNGDGIDDLLVCSPGEWEEGAMSAGVVEVFSGKDGSLLADFHGKDNEEFGAGACVIGDVDGDGHNDIVISCPYCAASKGGAVLLSGASGKLLRLLPAHKDKDEVTLDCMTIAAKSNEKGGELILLRERRTSANPYALSVVDPKTGSIVSEKPLFVDAAPRKR